MNDKNMFLQCPHFQTQGPWDPHHFTPRNWVKQAPFDWDPEGLQTAAGNEPPFRARVGVGMTGTWRENAEFTWDIHGISGVKFPFLNFFELGKC